MKKQIIITLSLLFFQATISADDSLSIDAQIDAIEAKRVGLSDSEISNVENPFIFKKIKTPKSIVTKEPLKVRSSTTKESLSNLDTSSEEKISKEMRLTAIMNDSALIDGEWYKKNQTISGFRVLNITRVDVVLVRDKERLLLSTHKHNANLKFK